MQGKGYSGKKNFIIFDFAAVCFLSSYSVHITGDADLCPISEESHSNKKLSCR